MLCLGTAGILNCPVERVESPERGGFFCTAHAIPGLWVLESIHNAHGTSLSWISKVLKVRGWEQVVQLAEQAPAGSNGLLFYPYLAGLGSPEFNSSVCGAFAGLTLNHDRNDIARAVIEGISFEMRRVIDAMAPFRADAVIRIVGGSSQCPFLMSTLADIAGQELLRLSTGETTLQGLAALTWAGMGRFEDIGGAMKHTSAPIEERLYPRRIDFYKLLYARYLEGVGPVKALSAVGGMTGDLHG